MQSPLARPTQRPGLFSGWRYDLLSTVQGRVLEIGVRGGPNFRYYPPHAQVVATDIDPVSMGAARRLFRRFPQGMALSLSDAQQLPFAPDSFDAVVATLVFCSIPKPRQALGEIARVLKPGGKFYNIDHVRAGQPTIGVLQDALAPAWKAISGGCHLNRDTEATLHAAGFTVLERRETMAGILRWFISTPPVSAPNQR